MNIVGANIVPWELQQLFDTLAKHVAFHGWLSNEHLRLLHHKVCAYLHILTYMFLYLDIDLNIYIYRYMYPNICMCMCIAALGSTDGDGGPNASVLLDLL